MQEVTQKQNEFSLKTYPAIYQHLNGYRKRLIARDDQGKFYWEFRSCTYYAEFEKQK